MTAETPTAEVPVTGEERQARVTGRDVARALVREPVVLLAVIFLTVLIIAAAFAPWLAPYDPLLPNIFAGRLAPLSTAQGPGGVDSGDHAGGRRPARRRRCGWRSREAEERGPKWART